MTKFAPPLKDSKAFVVDDIVRVVRSGGKYDCSLDHIPRHHLAEVVKDARAICVIQGIADRVSWMESPETASGQTIRICDTIPIQYTFNGDMARGGQAFANPGRAAEKVGMGIMEFGNAVNDAFNFGCKPFERK